MVGRRAFGPSEDNPHEDSWGKDIETGLKSRPKFKDAVELAMAQRTTHQLKKQLREGIDTSEYKKYRKSDDEVRMVSLWVARKINYLVAQEHQEEEYTRILPQRE